MDYKWVFQGGKVADLDAKKNLVSVKSHYEASKGPKDRIGVLYLGLNTKAVCGQLFALNHIASGVISLGIGNNLRLGGANDSEFDIITCLQYGNLSIDGQQIIKNGKYVL